MELKERRGSHEGQQERLEDQWITDSGGGQRSVGVRVRGGQLER